MSAHDFRARVRAAGPVAAALLLGCLACRQAAMAPAPAPGDHVREMARLSREGDVKGYLDCFSGELQANLRQAFAEAGEARFATLLRERMAPVKGMAISDLGERKDGSVELKVEWVFQDRNETQRLVLRAERGAWKITDMSDSQYAKPDIPYGTAVY